MFDTLSAGELNFPNRIIMAPLARARAVDQRVPNALMAEYYRQRASAGMILSEATAVCPMGVRFKNTPGIWSDEQVKGWQLVTSAVHSAGGRILLQLWHAGRVSHPSVLGGQLPVAPSAIAPVQEANLYCPKQSFLRPRALRTDELPGIVDAFRQGAANAKKAGFDGVHIHAANGYLLDQFLQDSANKRSDYYGGPVENRARLMLEVADACIEVWGPGRVGMHLSPRGDNHSMGDSNLLATFSYVAKELNKRKIAFIAVREYLGPDRIGPQLKRIFGGCYIANERFTLETAKQVIADGEADAVAFGEMFIANPDLPRRFELGAPLNEPRVEFYYADSAEGYTDYPFLAPVK